MILDIDRINSISGLCKLLIDFSLQGLRLPFQLFCILIFNIKHDLQSHTMSIECPSSIAFILWIAYFWRYENLIQRKFFWLSLHLSAYLVTFLAIFCQFYHFSDKCHKIEIVQTRTFANLKKTPSALFQIIKITFWCKNTTFFLYDMMPHLFKVQKLRTYLIRRLKFNNDNKCVFHFFGFFWYTTVKLYYILTFLLKIIMTLYQNFCMIGIRSFFSPCING